MPDLRVVYVNASMAVSYPNRKVQSSAGHPVILPLVIHVMPIAMVGNMIRSMISTGRCTLVFVRSYGGTAQSG